MPLYIIGLGLSDEKDITARGMDLISKCDKIYLDTYTAKISVTGEQLSESLGKEIVQVTRDMMEGKEAAIKMCEEAVEGAEVGFLVPGDPFVGTDHFSMLKLAREKGTQVEVVHNASISSAVGCTGL